MGMGGAELSDTEMCLWGAGGRDSVRPKSPVVLGLAETTPTLGHGAGEGRTWEVEASLWSGGTGPYAT